MSLFLSYQIQVLEGISAASQIFLSSDKEESS